jgi:hypothetical protein
MEEVVSDSQHSLIRKNAATSPSSTEMPEHGLGGMLIRAETKVFVFATIHYREKDLRKVRR